MALGHARVDELGGGDQTRVHVDRLTDRIINDAGDRVDGHGRPTRARGAPGTGPSDATSPADFSDGGGGSEWPATLLQFHAAAWAATNAGSDSNHETAHLQGPIKGKFLVTFGSILGPLGVI